MLRIVREPPRGLLNRQIEKFQLARYMPPETWAAFIEHYWIVRWDLRGQLPYLQENIPHPSVNLTVPNGEAAVFGVVSGKFGYLLEGQGVVLGVKFRPGGFYPWYRRSVSLLTDRIVPVAEVFGEPCTALEQASRVLAADHVLVAAAEAFLRPRLPSPDPTVALINQIIATVIANRDLIRVDQLVELFGMSKRTLQRMFSQYVGVSPKWVIMRYRLMEAADTLSAGSTIDLSNLAVDLGYFDQAHFIKDFKTIVGRTPSDYSRNLV